MVPLPWLIDTIVPIVIKNVARVCSFCHRVPKKKDADVHSSCSLHQLSEGLMVIYYKNNGPPLPLTIISSQVCKLKGNKSLKFPSICSDQPKQDFAASAGSEASAEA